MNHTWDDSKKDIATCIKCGVFRCKTNWRYCEKWWYTYKDKNGVSTETLKRPKCKNQLNKTK